MEKKQKKDDLLEITLWIRRSSYNLNRNFLKKISEGEPVIALADEEPFLDEEVEIISDDDMGEPDKKKPKFIIPKEKEKM